MTERENQQFIFGSIFLLSNKLQQLGDKVTGEITLKQWFLLNLLKTANKLSPNIHEIANMIGTSRQNISKMISSLEKKGMVKMVPSEKDHRAVYVSLTQKCLDYFTSRENAGNKLLDTIFQGIPSVESERTARLLGNMHHNIEPAIRHGEGSGIDE
jgi:DNA-binding MarR family transcriptional regulator